MSDERRLAIARWLLTGPALFLVIGPPVADFNATHVIHPDWTGHARLHTVWLVTTNSAVALVALGSLWLRPLAAARVSLAALLVGVVLGGFFVAAAAQPLYDGALTDPGGVPFEVAAIDANLAGFSVCALAVTLALVVARAPAARAAG